MPRVPPVTKATRPLSSSPPPRHASCCLVSKLVIKHHLSLISRRRLSPAARRGGGGLGDAPLDRADDRGPQLRGGNDRVHRADALGALDVVDRFELGGHLAELGGAYPRGLA